MTKTEAAELRETEAAELRELTQRNRPLSRRTRSCVACGLPVAGEPAGKRLYPLVSELAADGVPVAVACRVLKLARQPYYQWRTCPVTARELEQAHLANVLFDAHRGDPEFGYRLLADQARQGRQVACDRTVWRICADNGWWSVLDKTRGGHGKRLGPPAHEDRIHRDFMATDPSQLWSTDIERAALPILAMVKGHRPVLVAARHGS